MMPSRYLISVSIATLVPIMVACGGSTGGTAQPGGQGRSETSESQTDALSAPAGGSGRAGSIDVCGLLSEADAAAVARDRGLDGAQTAATVYKLKATPTSGSGTKPTSGCKFDISSDGASGAIEIDVTSGDDITLYTSEEKVPGLGDEAYSGGGQTVVRVGDLMLQTSENSFTEEFAVALYRKMIPKLK